MIETQSLLALLALIAGFYMAWNIGANDVANAMGTSVGSRALTLKKAVFLAAIFEFSGAFFVGGKVAETIQHGIVSPDVFALSPMHFVLGMLGALIATGILLQLASYFGLPISTTHAIVGAVLGFGLIAGGKEAVQWSVVGNIAASWLLSPLLSALVSYALFSVIQKHIFHASHPMNAAQKVAPLFVFLSISLVSWSLLYNGLPHFYFNHSLLSALVLSGTCGSVAGLFSWQFLRRTPHLAWQSSLLREQISSQSQGVEKIFVYLQIMSACLVAFSHGANDVANAIGPMSAVLQVLKHNVLEKSVPIPPWLLVLGGSGIVLGLATWGWRVIETVGSKITELTPTRGFCAEFGTAATILIASKLGLPISTTHALVGSIFGVGLARGIQALNLKTLKDIVLSWIVTIPLCALFSMLVYELLRWLFI